jgi:hypothetical protein
MKEYRAEQGIVYGENTDGTIEVQYNDVDDRWLVHTVYVEASSKAEAGDIVDGLINEDVIPDANDDGLFF